MYRDLPLQKLDIKYILWISLYTYIHICTCVEVYKEATLVYSIYIFVNVCLDKIGKVYIWGVNITILTDKITFML